MAGLNVDNFRVTELTAGAALGALVVEGTSLPAWAVGITFAAVSVLAGFVTRTWLVPILVGLSLFAAKPIWLDQLTGTAAEDLPALIGTTSATGPTPPEDTPATGSTVPPTSATDGLAGAGAATAGGETAD